MSLMLAGTAVGTTVAPISAGAQTGQGNSCLADVERLANAIGMSSRQPQAGGPATPQGNVQTEDLAQSGGVIKPPDVGAGRVMEPPNGAADGMNTAPAIPPQTAGPDGSSRGGTATRQSLDAAERAQVESLLTGARNAAQEGDTARCVESLEEARDLAREGGIETPM